MRKTLYIDADGCPVTRLAVRLAGQHGVACVVLCDTAHTFQLEGAETIVVSQGADSVDFALVNRLKAGDLVVTQDYGLAAMCLARGARVLHQDGMEYTQDNIEGLLTFRAAAQRARRGGGRMKGAPKRTRDQDRAFEAALTEILREEGP